MATRKPKADGLQALVAKQAQVSIQDLTMQDFFAAFALQGICASGPTSGWTNERLAAEAYDLADAMMKVREA